MGSLCLGQVGSRVAVTKRGAGILCHRLYSYVLGRPYILRKDFSNVEYPIDDTLGSQNIFSVGQIALIRLAEIVGEAIDKASSIVPVNIIY